ncbi:MAG: 1-acyl-sn-glycerol-3-phosphate acyltransferase [Bacteroidota bacterium]
MIKAKYTPLSFWWWKQFSHWGPRIYFKDFRVKGLENLPENLHEYAMLMIGNHMTMWDPFWVIDMCHKYFHKRFHAMMLEKELAKRMLLRTGGAYSINPGNRSMVESIAYTLDLLKNPQNLVLYFPQGRLFSQYEPEMVFQPGIEKVLNRLEKPVHICFFVSMIDYLSDFKPTLTIYLQSVPLEKVKTTDELQTAFQQHYDQVLATQKAEADALHGLT